MKAFWTGCYTESGKLDLVIMPGTSGDLLEVSAAEKKSKTHRISPNAPLVRIGSHIYIKDPIPIPCSRCVGCRMDKAEENKIRFCDEIKDIDPSLVHFITLTYGNWNMPVSKEGEPYLRKGDLDDFMMRLRRPTYGVNRDLTFFACGEYGGLFHRPHFHAVIVYPLDDLIPTEFQAYKSATVDKAWRHRGITQVKPVEPNLIAYVCGYCEKKQNDPFWDSYPVKPFISRTKGLGFKAIGSLDGGLDRKVYGNYGGVHYAGIPRAYLKKCEDKPWFKQYKDRSIEIGRQSLKNNIGMWKTADQDAIGFLLAASIESSLEDKRIDKL